MPAALLLLIAALLPQDSDKDKLKKFEEPFDKKEKKQDEPKKDGSKSKKDPFQDDDDEDEEEGILDAFASSIGKVIFDVVTLPFHYAFSDRDMRYDDYPYASGRRYFLLPRHAEKFAAFEAGLTVGRVEHDLWSIGLEGTIRYASGSDFHFDITQYQEDVDGGTDRLTLQQYSLNFGGQGGRRSYQVTFGIGLAVLDGPGTSDAAPLIQGDFIHFFKDPLSLKIHAGLMSFEDATVTDLRFELGIHVDRFAVTAGVRSLINSDGPELTGPTVGIAVFF